MGLQRVLIASTSPALIAGDYVCPKTVGGKRTMTKATPAALATAKHVYGIMPVDAEPGTYASVMIPPGTVDRTITGLGAGTISLVRVSTSARCERVTSFGDGDFAVGACDDLGNLTLALGAAAEQALAGLSDDGTTIEVAGGVVSLRPAYKDKVDALYIDLKADYGAVGNGSANDTTAFANAVAAVAAAGAGTIRAPRGTYLIDAQTISASNITFVGDGRKATTFKLRSAANHLFSLSGSQVTFQDCALDGNGISAVTVVRVTGGSNGLFDRCEIRRTTPTSSYLVVFDTGASKRWTFDHCLIQQNPSDTTENAAIGLYLLNGLATGIALYNCELRNAARLAMINVGPSSLTMENCSLGKCSTAALEIADIAANVSLWNCIGDETTNACPLLIQSAGTSTGNHRVVVEGCYWKRSSAANAVILTHQQPTILRENTWDDCVVTLTPTATYGLRKVSAYDDTFTTATPGTGYQGTGATSNLFAEQGTNYA